LVEHDDRRRLLIERELQNGRPMPLPHKHRLLAISAPDVDPLVADPGGGQGTPLPEKLRHLRG